MAVYVIHLKEPFHGYARHYIGYASVAEERIQKHMRGARRASRLLQLCKEEKIPWTVAVIHDDATPADEKSMKAHHHHARHCPICRNLVTYEEADSVWKTRLAVYRKSKRGKKTQ